MKQIIIAFAVLASCMMACGNDGGRDSWQSSAQMASGCYSDNSNGAIYCPTGR